MTELPFSLILQLMCLGLGAGFLAGLLGVGGGMVMVPFLTYAFTQQGFSGDLPVKMAIASAMASILFTSMSSIRAQQKRGAIDWQIVKGIAPGILIGALLASLGVFSLVKGWFLAIFFGIFVSYSATQMLRNKKPEATQQLPSTAGLVRAGTVIGFLSGLVGAGGGFISVPFMVRHNVPIHRAVATSSALGFPIALFNAAGFAFAGLHQANLPKGSLGFIYLPALLITASCSVLMAPVGVKTSHALNVMPLKRIFAMVLYLLAAYMLYKGISNWLALG